MEKYFTHQIPEFSGSCLENSAKSRLFSSGCSWWTHVTSNSSFFAKPSGLAIGFRWQGFHEITWKTGGTPFHPPAVRPVGPVGVLSKQSLSRLGIFRLPAGSKSYKEHSKQIWSSLPISSTLPRIIWKIISNHPPIPRSRSSWSARSFCVRIQMIWFQVED